MSQKTQFVMLNAVKHLANVSWEKELLGETKVNGANARSSGGDKPPLCRKQR